MDKHVLRVLEPNFNSFAVNSAATRLQSIDLARHYLLAPDLVK